MRQAWLTAGLLLLLLLPAASDPAGKRADWTILIYMTADTDLESHGMGDLVEMLTAKPSDAIRVIVQCDRAENDDDEEGYSGDEVAELGNFTGTRRLAIVGEEVVQLADIGEANMGDPKALADFVAWGLTTYPAERTALLFWDHGSGWPGYGGDDSHDHDMLDLHELEQGLAKGLAAGGRAQFDLLGFDCCLMAALEVMNAVQPYGKVLLSSEQLEPGEGWHYAAWLSALVAQPSMPAEQVAGGICDSFKAFFDKNADPGVRGQGGNITLSAIDAGKVPAVVAAVDALAAKLADGLEQGGRARWLGIARALRASEEYAGSGHHDLVDLAENLRGQGADAECAAVVGAVKAAVLHRIGSADCPRAHGISIYFPREVPEPEGEGDDPLATYAPCACSASWADLVGAYHEIAAADDAPPAVTNLGSSDAQLGLGEHSDVTAMAESEDLASAHFVLAEKGTDGEEVIIGMIPTDPESLDADFDGTWLAIGDKEQQLVAPISSFEEVDDEADVYLVGIPAIYRTPKRGHEIRVTLYFHLDLAEDDSFAGSFLYAFEEGESGPNEVDLRVGGKILPIYLVVNAEGELEERPVHDGAALTLDEDGLDLVDEELPAGKYLVGFVVEDYAGNVAEEMIEVAVER